MRTVAQRTGLSPHVIRIWEKRYGTIRPHRTAGNQRLYSEADVVRLKRLHELTSQGFNIGNITGLPDAELASLAAKEQEGPAFEPGSSRSNGEEFSSTNWIEEAMGAVNDLDVDRLETLLDKALLACGQIRMMQNCIGPLAQRIGEEWRAGRLRVAHEHLATATIRTFVEQIARPITVHPSSPVMISTTPAGQLHEMGAILVAAVGTAEGWRVTFTGAALPSEEIVRVATGHGARLVALSLIHPDDDPNLPAELRRLRRLLPHEIDIIAGGRASASYRRALQDIGATIMGDLGELRDFLSQQRRRESPKGTASEIEAASGKLRLR